MQFQTQLARRHLRYIKDVQFIALVCMAKEHILSTIVAQETII